jgi:uncharacterized delta-60 repeat protein
MRAKALLFLLLSLCPPPGVDADGMLDPSFGNGGLVTTDFPYDPFPPGFSADGASAVVVLPDGRAVAAGAVGDLDGRAMGAARYLTSGALDTTFGGDGLAIVGGCPSFGAGGGASAALLQPDGRLVLVGECPGGFSLNVARLNVDGSLDPSFGTGGTVMTPFPDGVFAAAGALQPDGRIVGVGTGGASGQLGVAAARYNADGSLDPSFGTGGTLTLALGQDFFVDDVALQADGKLVIAGTFAGGPTDFGLVRLLPNGALDASFDGDGIVTSDFGAAEEGRSVIVLGDGRIVLGGRRAPDFASDIALVRYLPDGSLDGTFGTGGLTTADSWPNEGLGQVIVLPNGKLLAAGSTLTAQGSAVDFLLARFHPDGGLDTSFGSSGFLKTDFNAGSSDGCGAVAVAGPDIILTAGSIFSPPAFGDFALARYIASIPVELLGFSVE